jgi:hypothetical protein
MVGAETDAVNDIMPVAEVLDSVDVFSSRRTLYDHRRPETEMKSEIQFHRLITPMTNRKKSRGTTSVT